MIRKPFLIDDEKICKRAYENVMGDVAQDVNASEMSLMPSRKFRRKNKNPLIFSDVIDEAIKDAGIKKRAEKANKIINESFAKSMFFTALENVMHNKSFDDCISDVNIHDGVLHIYCSEKKAKKYLTLQLPKLVAELNAILKKNGYIFEIDDVRLF